MSTPWGWNRRAAAVGAIVVLLWATAWTRPSSAAHVVDDAAVAAAAFESGAPIPDWVDPLDEAGAEAADPQAAVVRVADTQVHAGPPTTILSRRVLYVRDARALEGAGHVQTDFRPAFETLRLHRLQVVRDGVVIDHTRTATVRFVQREPSMESGVVTGVSTASIVVPDLRVGDTLRVTLSTTGTHPVLGPRFTRRVSWDAPYPIAWRRVTVVAPSSPVVRWQWMGGSGDTGAAPVVQTDADGLQRLRFEAAGLPPSAPESGLPTDVEPERRLQFSTYATWGEVSRWAQSLFPVDVPLPDEAVALVDRLRAVADRDAQVSQALQWVQSEIRNWSNAFGEGSHRPRPPTEVLRLRYGDCKDKSWLLMRLLLALGHDAQPVLLSASTLRGPAAWLPSPEAFDHAVVRVRLDGRDHYLDPTRQGQTGRLARMGQVFEGAEVLPVGPHDDALVTIRSPNLDEIASLSQHERFRIDRFDGGATLETELRWTGAAAEFLRVAARQVDLADWRDRLLAEYGRRYPGLSLVGEPELLDDREDNVFRLRGQFELPGPLNDIGNGAWGLQVMPTVLAGSLTLPERLPRRFALVSPAYPYRKRYDVEVTWPETVHAARGPDVRRVTTPHLAFEAVEAFVGRAQRWSVQFTALVPAVPAAEVPRFLDDVRGIVSHLGGQLTVTRDDCGGDCRDDPATGPAVSAPASPSASEPPR